MLKKKRLMGLMLIMVMVLSSIPVFALDEKVDNVNQLVEKVKVASEGEIIKLSDSFKFDDISIPVTDNNIIINGEGKEWESGTITVIGNGGGSLTIKNLNFGEAVDKRAFNINTSSRVILDTVNVNGRTEGGDGGALYLVGNGNLEILNSNFKNNTSSKSGYSGGAIASKHFNGRLLIDNTNFVGNENKSLGTGPVGGEGGAIYIYQVNNGANIHIINSHFEGNKAVENASGAKALLADGGAIAFFDVVQGANIKIENTKFYNNIAGDDGGAIMIQSNDNIPSGLSIKYNQFIGNISKSLEEEPEKFNGGAIYLYANGGRSTSRKSYVEIENNLFKDNIVEKNGKGGAVATSFAGWFNRFYANLKDNEFINNTPDNTAGSGIVNKGGNIGF